MSAPSAPGVPAITFAIPYYSNAAYLLEAIDSVRAQTVGAWEVIVVDDAGPEPVADLVAAIGDSRVRYVRNSVNLGLAGNWNECLRISAAPLVTLLHADDRVRPEYAAAVLEAARRDPNAAAFCTDAVVIGADGQLARSLPDFVKKFARRPRHDHSIGGDDGLAAMLSNNYVFCPSMCYRVELLDRQPFDGRWRMVLDLDHTARLLLRGLHLQAVRRPLYVYRRHTANQTSALTASATRFEEELALYRQLADAARAAGWPRTAAAARRHTMVRINLALDATIDLVLRRGTAGRRKAAMFVDDIRHRRGSSQHST